MSFLLVLEQLADRNALSETGLGEKQDDPVRAG